MSTKRMLPVTTPKGFRLVQVFLSPHLRGTYEVAIEWIAGPRRRLHCTCPGFARGTCKHVRYVRERLVDGNYPIQLHEKAYAHWDVEFAKEDQNLFRYLMLRHSKLVLL